MRYILMDNTEVELATGSNASNEAESGMPALDPLASGTDANIGYDAPYMTTTYMGKDINDIYSMLVSVRNSVLLLMMVVLVFEVHKVAKNAFKRHYDIKR